MLRTVLKRDVYPRNFFAEGLDDAAAHGGVDEFFSEVDVSILVIEFPPATDRASTCTINHCSPITSILRAFGLTGSTESPNDRSRNRVARDGGCVADQAAHVLGQQTDRAIDLLTAVVFRSVFANHAEMIPEPSLASETSRSPPRARRRILN